MLDGRRDGSPAVRSCPATAADIRERATTVAMHLLRRALTGMEDGLL